MTTMDPGEELLRTLLSEKNVSSVSSWENAIKCMESDARFDAVRCLPSRKLIFNEYKLQKGKEEKEEQRLRVKKAKEDLEQFLNNDPRVTSAMRYRQACEEFASLDVWKIVPDEERLDIFEDVMLEVRKREDDRARELRKRNRETIRDIFDSIPEITAQTTWLKAQQYLSQNDVFMKDENLHAMDKLDALEVFTEYIEQLEDEEREERRRERKEKAKQERENRFAFLRFLDELHTAGHLTSISKWQNLFQTISSDSRYIALLSQPLYGSTALDLFKFYVEDLKARYEDEKQIINEILKAKNFTITLDTTFVDFATFVSEDERSANLDGGNLKMIFERLAEKEREKERLRMRQVMKEKKKVEQAMFSILAKHIDVDDEVSLEWAEVKPLICEEPAYKAIESEEERIEIYKNYLDSMHNTCLHHHKRPKNSKCSHDSYTPPSITDSPPPTSASCIDPNSIDLGELERKRRQIIQELRSSKR